MKIRIAMGFTRRVLAGKTGMSQQNLQNIEKGRQRLMLHMVKPMCRALRVSAQELLDGVI